MWDNRRSICFRVKWEGVEGGSVGKDIACSAGATRDRFDPWVRKSPSRRKWQPTPVFLPREFHGQRSLAGYSQWGLKESDMTEQLTLFHFPIIWATIKFFDINQKFSYSIRMRVADQEAEIALVSICWTIASWALRVQVVCSSQESPHSTETW